VSPVRPPPNVAPPRGLGASPQVPPGRTPCAGSNKCGPSGQAPESHLTRDNPESRTPARRRGTDSRGDDRAVLP
jgi:hypothetical protein